MQMENILGNMEQNITPVNMNRIGSTSSKIIKVFQ